MNQDIIAIKEVIVVEGRDDTNAINRAVRAITIETHGFGISEGTWKKLDRAYEEKGLIIFTDPDHAGNEIRKKLLEKYPHAKEAFLSRTKAEKNKDIGIENAAPEDICQALIKAKASIRSPESMEATEKFTMRDLEITGLTGIPESAERREKLGDILGIGYTNGKSLLRKLNTMGISRKEFDEALDKIK